MTNGNRIEQTIAVIKPDAFDRNLVGRILTTIEVGGFTISRARLLHGGPQFAETWTKFYARQHEGKPYFDKLVRFMCSGPSMAMILRREEAISGWRVLMGPWDPKERYSEIGGLLRPGAAGTIRGMLMTPEGTTDNLVHGSDSSDSFVWEFMALEHKF